jgi:hypothetical protein
MQAEPTLITQHSSTRSGSQIILPFKTSSTVCLPGFWAKGEEQAYSRFLTAILARISSLTL